MSFFNSIRGFTRSSRKAKSAPNSTASNNTNASSNSGNSSGHNTPGAMSPAQFGMNQAGLGSGAVGSNGMGNGASNGSNSNVKPLFLCQPFVRAALVKGSFQTIVMLPKYVDLNEWLALNVFEFYTYLNQLYGVVQEFVCTPQTCPTMNAGPGVDYLWIDVNKKEVRLPANQYIEYVLTWISNKIDDQSLFPTKQGAPFPPHFVGVLKNIYRQMFRIFAHIYHNHFDKIIHLSLEAHWNSFFAHFISFGKTFNLLDRQDMSPLAALISNLENQGKIAY